MNHGCTIALGAALAASAALPRPCAAAELSEAEVDQICPPRPETAAEFKIGSYPQAARPYREAALKAFAYMASLPAMRTLVETGEPEQTYQHNAYVSKTHAAHINWMLEWARREPARRDEAMRLAAASAEYLLSQLEPPDAPLAWWPPTYGREPLRRDPADGGENRPSMVGNEPEGAVKYRGEVMLLYPADVGAAFVAYFNATGDRRFLDAAVGIGETYLKTRRPDGSWPLKMRLATGETIGENTLVPTRPLVFFSALAGATGEKRWAEAADGCFAWLEEHPLTDWNWDGQFEDIQPRPPYANPTKHNAVEAMFEILRRFPGDAARLEQCRRILRFCEKRFVCWERPENHPNWDAPSVLEQYSCFVPIDASAAKMIRAYLAIWRVTGETELLAKARTIADTITRVQTPEGRIPTFWTHDTLGQPLYDWLNCMGSSAAALLELDDACSAAAKGAVPCAYTPDILARPRLRGVMSGGGDMSEDDFKTLHEWGATLLRFQMVRDWHAVDANRDIAEYDSWLEGRLDHFDKVVLPLARKYGIMVVLDLHVPPGGRNAGEEGNMFYEREYADHFVEIWRRIARRFKGREGIYGYDLINEPCHKGYPLPGCDYWNLQRRAAEAVRAEDPNVPIIVESNHWDSHETFAELIPLPLANVIYEVHMYSPDEFTFQRLLGTRQWTVSYPNEEKGWNRDNLAKRLRHVRDFQLKYGAKIYDGEFSAAAWAQGAENYLRDCIDIFEEYGWDWTYHAFREAPVWDVEKEGETMEAMRPAASDTPRKQALIHGFAR